MESYPEYIYVRLLSRLSVRANCFRNSNEKVLLIVRIYTHIEMYSTLEKLREEDAQKCNKCLV